jgi:hypothetical protein
MEGGRGRGRYGRPRHISHRRWNEGEAAVEGERGWHSRHKQRRRRVRRGREGRRGEGDPHELCMRACTGYDAPQDPRLPVEGDEDRLAAVQLWLESTELQQHDSTIQVVHLVGGVLLPLLFGQPPCLSRALPSSARRQPLSAAVPPWFPPSWRGGPPYRLAWPRPWRAWPALCEEHARPQLLPALAQRALSPGWRASSPWREKR